MLGKRGGFAAVVRQTSIHFTNTALKQTRCLKDLKSKLCVTAPHFSHASQAALDDGSLTFATFVATNQFCPFRTSKSAYWRTRRNSARRGWMKSEQVAVVR